MDRDNYLRAVRFERPDRIPMHYHINGSCWNHYGHDDLYDLMESHPLLFPNFDRSSAKPPSFPPHMRADKPWTDPWGSVWEQPEDGMVGAVRRHALETWDGFDQYTPPDPDKTTHTSPIDWAHLSSVANDVTFVKSLRCGQVGHGHTFLKLIDIRGYENVLLDMVDEDPRFLRLLDMIETFNLGLVRNFLEHFKAEWMGYAEDLGMQNGPMLSPAHFRKYIKPSYQRIIAPAREAGCVIHMHSDGDIRLLADDLLDCGVEIVNLQDLVNGIDWIAGKLKGKVCVDLDIDRQRITHGGTPEAIDALIRQEVETLGSPEGGLMMTYGLYPGTPIENARAVADAMTRYAGHFAP